MKAKKLIVELYKIVRQHGKDIDVNILIDKNNVKGLDKVDYNPRFGGDGIVLE